MRLKKREWSCLLFTMMAVCCGIIWAMTNLSYDGMYQISMSQRFLSGDKMILEMWEPHQTSVFLSAALMWVYETVFQTTTGIVLYLQVCGIVIRGAIAVLLYRIFRGDLGKSAAYRMALLFFMISPKDHALPEFSNMQLWYSALLFCCLYVYFKTGKRRLLAAAALFLCLEVLAYPSCLLVYPGVIALLLCFSQDKQRDIALFTGVCAGAGAVVAGYFFLTLGTDTVLLCLKGMFALEPTHTVSMAGKMSAYFIDVLKTFPVYLAALAAAFCVSRLLLYAGSKHRGTVPSDRHTDGAAFLSWVTDRREKWQFFFLCFTGILLVGFFFNILSADKRSAYTLILLFVVAVGFFGRKNLTGEEKKLYACLSVIGGAGFFATLVLSDQSLFSSVAYGLLAIMAAWIPIERAQACAEIKRGIGVCFAVFVMLLAFRCVYIRTPMSGRGQICSIFSDLSMVRMGPALGIVTNDEGVHIEHDTYLTWKERIRPGDRVWIIGGVVNTLGYLYEDVEVAGPSTMSTPSYNSEILKYWRLNPDKYPDVIVAECSYQENIIYELLMNDWLQSWLKEEYQAELVAEGTYWIYLFKRAR